MSGRFCVISFGVVGPCFCWGFGKKRVIGRGFLVVKSWWIAGESWEVDGQFSGSKNMPLFRIYFRGIPILGIFEIWFGLILSDSETAKFLLADYPGCSAW